MRYFGTDGIRDRADALLARKLPYLLGRALSQTENKIIVARDVRTHSRLIENMLVLGLLDGKADIYLAGVLPTPALAYIAALENADYAVMITASHNPPLFNGLKVFGKSGRKLSESEERALDDKVFELDKSYASPREPAIYDAPCLDVAADVSAHALTDDETRSKLNILPSKTHRVRIVNGAQELYKNHVKSMFPRFDGIKVKLDCAMGCMAQLAKGVFEELGANVTAINDERDGEKVNVKCGSTHLDAFIPLVARDELGFAFDGDGDRVLAVADGKRYDGDGILLALSALYRIQGKLKKKFVVGTQLTNTRLQRELAFNDIALIRTDVGDKHVLNELLERGCLLGGEKSGHILMLDRANTGDGLITALSLLEVKKTLGSLPRFTPYPMIEFNVSSTDPAKEATSPDFMEKVSEIKAAYGNLGRFIIRPSGTEPFIRVAFECFSPSPEPIFESIKKHFGA